MILYDNSLIKIEYNPASDILEVAYPDLHEYLLPEIRHSIDKLVENTISYDVKRLLLNSSQTVVAVEVEKSREITAYMLTCLSRTRIQKLARLQSFNPVVELIAEGNIRHVNQIMVLPFELRNFTSKETAKLWLTE